MRLFEDIPSPATLPRAIREAEIAPPPRQQVKRTRPAFDDEERLTAASAFYGLALQKLWADADGNAADDDYIMSAEEDRVWAAANWILSELTHVTYSDDRLFEAISGYVLILTAIRVYKLTNLEYIYYFKF